MHRSVVPFATGRCRSYCTALLLCGSVYLAGCSPFSSAWKDSLTNSVKSQDSTAGLPAQLDPRYEYIRATVRNSTFLLTRAATEPSNPARAGSSSDSIGVWVTPAGEIVRLDANGRLAGSSGVSYVDWRRVTASDAPTWTAALSQTSNGQTVRYIRSRDVQPGDHYGLTDTVTIRRVNTPKQPNTLVGVQASALQWFEESSQLDDPARRTSWIKADTPQDPVRDPLPPARFAVKFLSDGQAEVVYSEQCLSAHVCLAMQRWPAQSATPTQTTPTSNSPATPAS